MPARIRNMRILRAAGMRPRGARNRESHAEPASNFESVQMRAFGLQSDSTTLVAKRKRRLVNHVAGIEYAQYSAKELTDKFTRNHMEYVEGPTATNPRFPDELLRIHRAIRRVERAEKEAGVPPATRLRASPSPTLALSRKGLAALHFSGGV